MVVDASAALELLLRTPRGEAVEKRLFQRQREALCAPHLLDVEVVHVLRRLVAAGHVEEPRARQALLDLADMALTRYPHDPLVGRMWRLRDNLTAYDAAYVALAESLDAPLITCDRRLAGCPGVSTSIEWIGE
jgi:predicted nucleic acid-binding protein